MDYKKLTLCYKALGDETRLQILLLLKNQNLCACKILEYFNISQSTLSYHMKQLVDCGLVDCQKNGSWNHYSINKECLDLCKTFFENID